MAYSGEVRINTKIDSGGVNRGVKEIERDIARATRELEKLTSGSAEPKSIKAMRQEISMLENDLKSAESASKPLVQEFENAVAKLEEMRSIGFSEDSLQDQIAEVDRLAKKLRPFDRKIEAIQNRISDVRAEMEAIRLDPSASREADNIRAEIERLNEELSKSGDNTANNLSRIGDVAKAAARVAVGGLRRVGSVIVAIGKGAARAVRGLRAIGRGLRGVGRSSRGASRGMDMFWRRLRNVALGAVLFNVIRRAISGLMRDLGNLLMANEEFANSFNAIRVNMLTAFAPIWEVIKPALISFMNVLARVTAMVAQFMATLFGTTVGAARDSAKALNNQAQGLRDVGGAADDARNELASFDEINQQSADTAGGGAGANGGGMNFDIGEPQHFQWIDDLLEMLRSFDAELEYFENLGKRLAERIIQGLYSIDWDRVKFWADIFGQRFGAFLNGVFAGSTGQRLFEAIGMTIAEGFNTALTFLYGAARTFRWGEVGRNLASGFNRFMRRFDWQLAAGTINSISIGFLDMLIEAVQGVEWNELGENVAMTLNDIDWTGIIGRKGTLAGQVMRAIVNTLSSLARDFNFSEFGRAFGVGINNLFKNFSFRDLAQGVSRWVIGLLDMLISFLRETNWGEIGNAIREFFVNLDWAGIFKSLTSLIGELLTAVFDFMTSLFGEGGATALLAIVASIAIMKPKIIAAMKAMGLAAKVAFLGKIGLIIAAIAGIALAFDRVKDHLTTEVVPAIQRFGDDVSESTRYMLNPIMDNADNARRSLIELFVGGKEITREGAWEIADYFRTMASDSIQAVEDLKNRALQVVREMFGREAELYESQKNSINLYHDNLILAETRRGERMEEELREMRRRGQTETEEYARLTAAHEQWQLSSIEYINNVEAEREEALDELRANTDFNIEEYYRELEAVKETYGQRVVAIEEGLDEILQAKREHLAAGGTMEDEAYQELLLMQDEFLNTILVNTVECNYELASIQQTRADDLHRIETEAVSNLLKQYAADRDNAINTAWDKHSQLKNEFRQHNRRMTVAQRAAALEEISEAKAHALRVKDEARENYNALVREAVRGMDNVGQEINLRNGQIHTRWSKFWEESNNIFARGFRRLFRGSQTGTEEVVGGIEQGLNEGVYSAADAMGNVAEGMDDAWQNYWVSRSPSRLMIERCRDVINGGIMGLQSRKPILVNTMTQIMEALSNIVIEFSEIIIETFEDLADRKISIITALAPNFVNGFKNMFNNALNVAGAFANNMVRTVHDMALQVQAILASLGPKAIHIDVPSPRHISIPRLARGGIVDGATIAMLGEKGKEAVVPLENNTEWMEGVADRIGERIVDALGDVLAGFGNQQSTFEVDGRVLGRVVYDLLETETKRRRVDVHPRTILGGT